MWRTAMQAGGRGSAWSPVEGDGLPGGRLGLAVKLLIPLAVVVGLYLLIATPTLPNERQRTSAAPPAAVATPQRTTGAGGQAPPAAAPATSAPPRPAGAATPA